MEEQRAFLFRAVDALEQARIPYAVTGSWASTTYGMPRMTHDMDLIVALDAGDIPALIAAFPPPAYADEAWIREAVTTRTMFNIIDPASGDKIDFWPLKDDDYSQRQFARRRAVHLFGRDVWVLAPEDVILAKLLWYRLSESELQLRDAVGVWKTQQGNLDLDYLRAWAARLGTADLLSKVMAS